MKFNSINNNGGLLKREREREKDSFSKVQKKDVTQIAAIATCYGNEIRTTLWCNFFRISCHFFDLVSSFEWHSPIRLDARVIFSDFCEILIR